MKRRQKLISLFLCLVMAVGLIPFITMQASAVVYTDGDWRFTVADGEASITEYRGSAAYVTVPATVKASASTCPVKRIDSAFKKNTTIISVTIPGGVTEIGAEAFYDCTNLVSVTIPDTVAAIGDDAFGGCIKLSSATLPEGLTSIGMQAFSAAALTNVRIPSTVTSIGEQAFLYCTALTKVQIFADLTAMGSGVFRGCSKLTEIVLPTELTSIGSFLFDGCASLQKITIFDGVASVGDFAFRGCTSLDMVLYSGYRDDWEEISISSLGNDCLMSATKYYVPQSRVSGDWVYTVSDAKGTATINEYTGSDSKVTIPGTLGGYPVTRLMGTFQYNNQKVTNVSIPNGVTVIGDNTFYNCSKLTSVSIPSSVQVIGRDAFNGCISLAALSLPNGLTKIGDQAFGALSIMWVTIPSSVQYIGDQAFYCCTKLDTVNIQTTNVSIGSGAFNSCDGLQMVNFSGSYDQWNALPIGSNNEPLKEATIQFFAGSIAYCGVCGKNGSNLVWTLDKSWKLTITGTGAMADYSAESQSPWRYSSPSIKSIVIGYGVTSIGSEAFWDCSWLASVTIPVSLTYIGNSAFYGCDSLTDIYYDGTTLTWSRITGDLSYPLDMAEVHFTAVPPYINSISEDRIAPAVGETVTWTAHVSGGCGKLQYCFYIYQDGAVVYNTGYGTASSVPYTPTEAGSYKAKVFVKDEAGQTASRLSAATSVSAGPPVISGITANKTSAFVGESITWTAAVTGGAGTLRYCFYIYKDGTVVYNSGYGTASSIPYTPTEAGSYKAKVFVKDEAGKSAARLSGVTTVTAGSTPITIIGLTADKTSAATGEKITWTAAAVGGTGTLRYCFYVYKDGAVVYNSGYGLAASVPYTPTEAGSYKAKVFVKDSAGKSATRLSGVTTVTAAATPITVTGLAADKTSAIIGEKITWTASASGGSGTLRYCFYVYKDGTVVYNSGYGTSTSVPYTPTEAGSYKAKVFVKDSAGKSATRLSGVTTVTDGEAPLAISGLTVNKSTAAVGDPLVWTAAASGGSGTLRYCFYIYRDGTVVQKGSYGTTNVYSYTPTLAGTYSAKVFVKDGAGKSASKTGGNCIVG